MASHEALFLDYTLSHPEQGRKDSEQISYKDECCNALTSESAIPYPTFCGNISCSYIPLTYKCGFPILTFNESKLLLIMKWTTRSGTMLEIINTGNFLLDGGAMFGRIPKTMWERWFPADNRNRIVMACNLLKIRTPTGRTYLVDAGMGSCYDAKELDIMGYHPASPVIGPIDCLICTHLHFDHVGGVHDLKIRESVVVTSREWADAHKEDPLSRGSYRAIDLKAMSSHLQLIDPPCDLDTHVRIIPTPGHTAGHCSVIIDDEVCYAGDLIPTAAHCHLPCIMAYDLFPLEIVEHKRELMNEAVNKGWTLIFEHDPSHPSGQIAISRHKYKAVYN